MIRLLAAAAAGVLLVSPALAAPPSAPTPAFQPAPGCGDFLAATHRKPAHVRYLGCAAQPNRQGKPLRARYRVEGRFAAAVEAALIRSTGLRALERSCCQWDTPARTFDAGGREFTIRMVSDETPVRARTGWARVPRFEITVDMLTEEI